MPLSSAWDVKVMNEVFGGVDAAPPATLYFGLSTTAPAKDSTGVTEPSANGYARVAMTNNATNFPTATTSAGVTTKQNGTVITFPQASGSWGTPGYWVVYDAASGGTLVAYGNITTPKAVGSGDTPSFSANGIQVTMQ
jgi:hypothetical protein